MSEDLSLLRPREREIYTRKQRGLSNAQIAAEMGITDDNVRAVISIARKRLNGLATAFGTRPVGRPLSTAGLSAVDKKRCGRCGLRGHVAGDPEKCLPSAAEYASRRIGDMRGGMSMVMTGEHKNVTVFE